MSPDSRSTRALRCSVLPALLAGGLLSGCAAVQRAAEPAPPPPQVQAPAPASAPVAPPPAPSPAAEVVEAIATPVRGAQPGAVRVDTSASSASLLLYAERLRRMAPPELALELSRLGEMPEQQRQAYEDMQLALALTQTRVPSDGVRAQALIQRVLANTREEVRGLHPLAWMLASRYNDQKRLEETIDKQNQQLRDNQRRIDQLNERLEAVRAIERSLTARPAPPASAPANGMPRPSP
jgi:hypothetical protein